MIANQSAVGGGWQTEKLQATGSETGVEKKARMWQKQHTRGNNVLQVGQSLAAKLAVNVELSHPNVERIPVCGQILFSDTQQDLKVINPFYFVKSLVAGWSVAGHGDGSHFVWQKHL